MFPIMQQGDKRSWIPGEEAWTRDMPLNHSKSPLREKIGFPIIKKSLLKTAC